jgi:hypothetical protein
MSTKFFLFHKEEVGQSSVTESDTGVGISIFAVPASSISHISASYGYVRIVFNDAGLYDFIDNNDNEAIRKTIADVDCKYGEESKLIEDILNFINSSSNTVMKFDFVNNNGGFRSTRADGSVRVRIRTSPDILSPKQTEFKAIGATSSISIIDGVSFAANQYPVVDYNPTGMQIYGGTGAIEYQLKSWDNSSELGGTGYNLDSSELLGVMPFRTDHVGVTGSVGREYTGLNEKSLEFFSDGISITSEKELILSSEYTIYYVFGIPATKNTSRITPESDPWEVTLDRVGTVFYNVFSKNSGFNSFREPSMFFVSDSNCTSGPAKSPTNDTKYGTIAYEIPDKSEISQRQTCYVFVIRRDASYNLYMHNHRGEIVSFIPANTNPESFIGRTDGDMVIDGIGYYGQGVKNYICRAGVIQRDIGSSEASRIAQELYNRYKP